MMRALVHRAFGPPASVLAVRDVPRPAPRRREVLVRVRAVGIARGTWLLTRGLPYIARPSYGLWAPKQSVAGLQFAGTVEALGDDVRGIAPADDVFGYAAGTLAEYVAVPEDAVARMPARVSFAQAAAAPVSGVAALQAVRDSGRVHRGQRVLVIGASGGVGSFVVQIAKASGAEVTGVASARHLDSVRELGADHVIDYARTEPTACGQTYDVVIDLAGNRRVSRLRRIVRQKGTLVMVGGTGGNWTMGFGRTVGAVIRGLFVRQRIVGLISEPRRRDLAALAELMAHGFLNPVVAGTVPLNRAAEAIETVGSTSLAGTMIVTV